MDRDKLGALIEMHSDTLKALKELWEIQYGLSYPNVIESPKKEKEN